MEKRGPKYYLFVYAMLAPALIVSLGIVIWPIINTLIRSFQPADGSSGFTLEHYKYLFTDKLAVNNILFTLYIVVVTVVLSVVISYLLALYLRFYDTKISRFVGTIYLLPRFVPALVATYAMMTVIRDSGLINRICLLFGYDYKPGLLYTANGMIIMNLWFNVAFATMVITASLSAIPDSIVESARDVGAGKLTVFRKMIIPLSYKDVMIASTFVFMSNLSSFTTPYVMGPNQPQMLGVYLYFQFSRYHKYELSAALSVLMFVFSSISAAVYIYTNLKEQEWEKTARDTNPFV